MNQMEQPAQYPDAGAVLTAFFSSGRRHLLLTGSRKTGKTTLLSHLAVLLRPQMGITTDAVPGSCVRMRENATGETVIVGRYDPSLPGSEQKMAVEPQGFDGFGVRALHRCGEMDGEWVSVDEIGYLERGCTEYLSALNNLMEKKRLIAVVRKQTLPHLDALLRREDVFVLDLDRPYGKIGCVIMASGMGVRFGGNKLMADFHGVPMIRCALDCTEGFFARRVVVTRHRAVAEYCERMQVQTVLHDLPHRNDTVRIGLEAVGDVDACMFCPGDQPLLRRETVAALVMASAATPAWMYRAASEDTVGAPVLFPAWTYPQLRTLPQGKGGGYVLKQHPASVRRIPVRDRMELVDADTQDDLRLLQEYRIARATTSMIPAGGDTTRRNGKQCP